MKRRGFLKGLAALALAPMAVASKAATPEPLPAHTVPNPSGPVHVGPYTKKAVALAKQAMKRMATASDNAAKAAAEMREALTDIYISSEAMEDIRAWGVDQFDEEARKAIMVGDIFDPKGEIKDDHPYACHCQHINVSMPLDREEINELGRRGPYYRFVQFPVELEIGDAVLDNRPEQLEKFDA